jgi:hypothetical protein
MHLDMNEPIAKDILQNFKWLGIYQIAGGIIGLALTLWLILNQVSFSPLIILLFLIAVGLYFFSIYCGFLLINKEINGLTYSIINLYPQLINFSLLGFSFQYISGLFLSFGVDLTNEFLFKFNLGVSTWLISVGGDSGVILVNFNIVALSLIIFMEKIKYKLKAQKNNSAFSLTQEIN